MAAADGTSREQALEPEAFKKLYPEQYYQRFIDSGVRPDGRPFGRCRPTTIGLDAVGTADASALVKVGSTTALAGIKLEARPDFLHPFHELSNTSASFPLQLAQKTLTPGSSRKRV